MIKTYVHGRLSGNGDSSCFWFWNILNGFKTHTHSALNYNLRSCLMKTMPRSCCTSGGGFSLLFCSFHTRWLILRPLLGWFAYLDVLGGSQASWLDHRKGVISGSSWVISLCPQLECWNGIYPLLTIITYHYNILQFITVYSIHRFWTTYWLRCTTLPLKLQQQQVLWWTEWPALRVNP